jgi:hypothetical protein
MCRLFACTSLKSLKALLASCYKSHQPPQFNSVQSIRPLTAALGSMEINQFAKRKLSAPCTAVLSPKQALSCSLRGTNRFIVRIFPLHRQISR